MFLSSSAGVDVPDAAPDGKGGDVADRSDFLKSYPAVMTGLVVLLAGAAAGGISLTFAGADVRLWAIVFGVLAVAGIGGGIGLLVTVFGRRGGLLRARVTRRERTLYREEYREGEPESDADKSRTRQV